MSDSKFKWQQVLGGRTTEEMVQLAFSEPIDTLFNKINKEYLYWDKFKYLNNNENIPIELAWSCVQSRRFFQLKPLPLHVEGGQFLRYWLPDSVLNCLYRMDRLTTEKLLEGHLPSKYPSLLKANQMKESLASGQLEGNGLDEKINERWTHNNYRLLINISNYLDRDFDQNLVQTFYQELTQGIPPAMLELEIAGEEESELAPLWFSQFENLKIFLNDRENDSAPHPLIKAGLGYFSFLYFRPFGPLSARLGRGFLYWYLQKMNYPFVAYLSISTTLNKLEHTLNRSIQYTVQDQEDLTYFIFHYLNILEEAVQETKSQSLQSKNNRDTGYQFFQHLPHLNERQHLLMMEALKDPGSSFTIKAHQTKHHIVYETARTDLLRLEKQGLLKSQLRAKEFVFMPVGDLNQKITGKLTADLK